MIKKIIILLNYIVVLSTTTIFATDKSYDTIAGASNTLLNALSWFGYALALGILIWIGIKYVMSSANEKANLKSTFSMYLIGVVLITCCSTIAKGVSMVSSSVGDNTAGGIVDAGLNLGGITVGDKEFEYIPDVNNIGNFSGRYYYTDKTMETKVENGVTTDMFKVKGPDLEYAIVKTATLGYPEDLVSKISETRKRKIRRQKERILSRSC